MRLLKALPMAVILLSGSVHAADDYPTIAVVRDVVECMADLGAQNEQNLYTCTCRHDYIASKMPFEEFENGTMMVRYNQMPGEKGGVVRDNEKGKKDMKHLLKLKEEAAAHCPIVKSLTAPPPRDDS